MEWKIDVIFPVVREMTIVAEVSRPETTAREEVKTVMAGWFEDKFARPFGGDGVGVG